MTKVTAKYYVFRDKEVGEFLAKALANGIVGRKPFWRGE